MNRIESDLIGNINVPQEAFYGAQTQRAVLNFPLNKQRSMGSYPLMVKALLLLKKATALTNQKNGELDIKKAKAIIEAADRLLDLDDKDEVVGHFPIHALHGGGGTSANMNANEVLANMAEELLGGKRGEYRFVHPNNDVNCNQSTNDVYPSACHLAIIFQWQQLSPVVERLIAVLQQKGEVFKEQRKIARTCLQDAVDISFADFLGGYSSSLARHLRRLHHAVDDLHAISLGGTIVGRPEDCSPAYFEQIIPTLNSLLVGIKMRRSDNLFDASQNLDDMVAVSANLALFARHLIKIARDLRLLSSGPETGLAEIYLPAVQPGSSIMPGKINPVIPEFVIQSCFKVIGNHASCAEAINHGELDLNVWESIALFTILESMELLDSAIVTLIDKCLVGLEINQAKNQQNTNSIIAQLTSLSKIHGYAKISALCKQAGGDVGQIRELIKGI